MKKINVAVFLSILIFFAAMSEAALPTGMKFKPFYDFNKVSFTRDRIKTIWMEEVPGMPQHFWVLGWYGYIHALYPDTIKTYAPGEMKDYTRTQIADFHDIVHPSIYSEYGAWNISFHPKFTENRKFYIIYMGMKEGQSLERKTGGIVTVDEWVANGEGYMQPEFSRTIFTYDHVPAYGVSCMTFGPDGYLYISCCDYGTDSYDLTHHGRKILRIDVDTKEDGMEYGIPDDNPLVNSSDPNVKKEIWAWGIRNVWGLHFDTINDPNGILWAGEIGQNQWEELNIIKKGTHGGWADKGDGTSSAFGYGFSGPCKDVTPTVSTRTDPRDCSEYEPPFWAFARNPNLVAEGTYTDVTNIASIVGGQTFEGAKDSPFYGWHIFTDTWSHKIFAAKPENRAIYEWGTAASLTTGNARWVWYPEDAPVPEVTRYFRAKFSVPSGKTVSSANLVITADNTFTAYVNGQSMGSGTDWKQLQSFDVKSRIQSGTNVLAVQAGNVGTTAAGLIGNLAVTYSDGSREDVATGSGWKTANSQFPDWNQLSFDDAPWLNIKDLGGMGVSPWGNLGSSSDRVTVKGSPPELVGEVQQDIRIGRDGHNGVVYIGQDTYGNLYGVLVSWIAGQKYHEIYMFDHPDLTPKVTGCMDPTRSDYNPNAQLPGECTGASAVDRIERLQKNAVTTLIANTGTAMQVSVPAYASGIEVFNPQGQMVWKGGIPKVGRETSLMLPGTLPRGILQVRPVF